jgi:two-component system, response regulator
MNEKYILLAEDNDNDVELTKRALKKCQIAYGVVVVSNGKQAMDFLLSKDLNDLPSVVLLDLKLPLIDGIEILQRIRANDNTKLLPVVMLTASVDEKDRKESLRLGANDFQCKPVNFDDFVQLIGLISSKWLAN